MNNLAAVYEQDFSFWLSQNVELLREGRVGEIDVKNIAEELDDMGKNQHRELVNLLKILFAHLLKWQFQPECRSGSWKGTVVEQRHQIEQLLEMSPSLKHQIDEKISKAYKKAVEYAAAETGVSESVFPKTCPYTLEDALDKDFFPEDAFRLE